MKLHDWNQKMEELLFVDFIPGHVEKDRLQNGIQSWGREDVRKVGFAVSASIEVFKKAVEEGCDALVVHHGILPGERMDQYTWERLAFLAKNDLTLWSAHYTLDAHPVLGNNAQILKAIGVDEFEPYVDFSGAPWGHIGNLNEPLSIQDIVARLQERMSPDTIVYDFGPELVQRIVAVSGKGAPGMFRDMFDLQQAGADLYITGEVHEWNREMFREVGMHMIAGGHYHTETFGVQALQHYSEQEWGIETAWIDLPNNV